MNNTLLTNASRAILFTLALGFIAGCSTQQSTIVDNNTEVSDVNAAIANVVDASKDQTLTYTPQVASTDPLPDLIVSSERLLSSITYATETYSSSNCTTQEGKFAAGTYRTMRFDGVVINNGNTDLNIGNPATKVDPNGDGNPVDGSFEWANCHQHYHFKHFAKYELIPVAADGTQGTPIQARKLGFCMMDNYRTAQANTSAKFNCNNQGISRYWGDIYSKNLQGQMFLLNEPGSVVQPGQYIVRITANAPFFPAAGEPCPVPVAGSSACRMFAELDYSNNAGEAKIDITAANLGQSGTGGGGGTPSGSAPCTNCDAYTGTLGSTRASAYTPSSSGFAVTSSRTLSAWLNSPSGGNFDLYLEKKSFWGSWSIVARSENATSTDSIAYNAGSGTYRWRVYSTSGTGAYNLWVGR